MKKKALVKRKKTSDFEKLAKTIAMFEGKLHQASIGDIREILKIIEDLFASEMVYARLVLKDTQFDNFINRIVKKAKKLIQKSEKAKKK